MAVHRYIKAKTKYIGELYNPMQESSFFKYLNANNLYGWAMSHESLANSFKWISNVDKFTAERIY